MISLWKDPEDLHLLFIDGDYGYDDNGSDGGNDVGGRWREIGEEEREDGRGDWLLCISCWMPIIWNIFLMINLSLFFVLLHLSFIYFHPMCASLQEVPAI